jgi:putative two-component system response regulator
MRLDSQDDLIFSMAKLADCRSPETGKHLVRVKEFTLLPGRQLVVNNPELGMTESIEQGNKPGRQSLTDQVFNLIHSS